MNLGRIFANAIARRVAYVLVALAFAALASLFGMGNAHAQDPFANCHINSVQEALCPNKETAYAAAKAANDAYNGARIACLIAETATAVEYADSTRISGQEVCPPSGVPQNRKKRSWPVGQICNDSDGAWNDETKSCDSCSARPVLGGGAWSGVNDDMQMCLNGCTFEGGTGGAAVGVCFPVTIDGTVYQSCTSWGPTGSACSAGVGNGSLAPPDRDGDGTSDGNDSAPNNPGSGGGGGENGEGQAEDGSKSCGGPDQPVCEADGSNSGSGKGNTSGGGGNCQTPPSSTGDAILAQIAYQTWATRCAVEGQGQGGTGTGPGDGAKEGTLKGIKDFLDGNGQSLDEPSDPWMDGDGITESDWNMGLGGGSCPAPVSTTISLAGVSQSIDFSFQPLCDLAGLLNVLFKALGAFIAAFIIAGVRR